MTKQNLEALLQDLVRLGCTVTFCSLDKNRAGAHVEHPGRISIRQFHFGETAEESLMKAAAAAEVLAEPALEKPSVPETSLTRKQIGELKGVCDCGTPLYIIGTCKYCDNDE